MLNDVFSQLSSEKNIERKRGASKLELLVKENNVISELDRNTLECEGSKSRDVTWDTVIQNVAGYVLIEINNTKATSTEAVKKRLKEVASLYKTTITAAERRGPIIKSNHVYKHVLFVLKNDNYINYFIEFYSRILLKSILSKKKHANEIGATRWDELVVIYCNLLCRKGNLKNDRGTDDVLYASVLQKLLEISGSMPYVNTERLFSFFKEIFGRNRNWNITLLEVLISGLNNFLWVCCVEYRKTICTLGEDLMSVFINFWKYKNQNVMIQLIEFFHIQFLVHSFPANAASRCHEGIYPWLNENWKKVTKDIFELIYVEISSIKTSHSVNGDKYQRKLASVASILINQMVNLSKENQKDYFSFSLHVGGEHKRCRISVESPWDTVLNALKTSTDNESKVLWLKVIEEIFNLKLSCVNIEKAGQLLCLLHEMLVVQKNENAVKWILTVSISCIEKIPFNNMHKTQSIETSLKAIQRLSMKHVKNINCQGVFCMLAYHMLTKGILTFTRDVFQLFSVDGIKVTRESMALLSAIIQSGLFPEDLGRYLSKQLDSSSSSTTTTTTTTNVAFPLRNLLKSWLSPIPSDDSNQNLQRNSIKEMALFAGLLFSKCPITFARMTFGESFLTVQRKPNRAKTTQQLLWSTTFDWNLVDNTVGVNTKSIERKAVCRKLDEEMNRFLESFQNCLGNKASLPDLCEYYMKVVLFFLHVKNVFDLYLDSHPQSSQMGMLAGHLDEQVTAHLRGFLSDERFKEKGKHVCKILEMVEETVKNDEAIGMLVKKHCIKLQQFLLHTMTGKTLPKSCGNNSTTSAAASVDDFMDFEFEKTPEQKSSTLGMDNNNDVAGVCREIQIRSCSILAYVLFQSNVREEEEERENFMIQLEEINDSTTSLSMLFVMNELLQSRKNLFTSKELLTLVNLTWKALSNHRNDQDVCVQLLDGIVHHVCVIRMFSADSFVEDTRLILVKLLQVFVSLGKEKYSSAVRCKIADALFKLTEVVDETGLWKLEVKTQDTHKHLFATDIIFQMLYEDDFTVQLYIVLKVDQLFNEITNNELERHKKMLSKTFERLSIPHEGIPTKTYNHMLICLHLMKKVICACPVLEKYILSMMFKLTNQKFLKVNFVLKTLANISMELNYANTTAYISERLEYILHDYIEQGNNIQHFPVAALGMSFSDFLSNFGQQHVIPCLVAIGQMDAVRTLHQEMATASTFQDVLIKSFASISFLTLLPYFKSTNGASLDAEESVALSGLEKYREIVGAQNFNAKLQEKSQDIILQALLHLHDPCDNVHTRYTSVHTFHPLLSSEKVHSFISNLAMCYGETKKPITILVKSMDSIPRILASLSNDMLTAKLPSMKLSFLKAYSFIVNFLLENFSSLEKYCGRYIVRHIVHTSVYLLQSETENWEASVDAVRITFEILSSVISKIFTYPIACEEVVSCLSFLVNNLIDFDINHPNSEEKRTLELLRKLVIEGTSDEMSLFEFTNAVAMLDLFPEDEEKFTLFNERLEILKATAVEQDVEKELTRHFNSLNQSSTLSPPRVCLQNIKRFLLNRSSAIVPCRELYNLASFLLEKSKLVKCEESKLLTVQCLSIIAKIGINSEDKSGNSEDKKSTLSLILERLSVLCTSIDTATAKVSVECLKTILQKSSYRDQVMSCQKFEFFTYLKPFILGKKNKENNQAARKIPSKTKGEYKEALTKTKELRISHDVTYNQWMSKLNEILLTCGAIQEDCFLELLPLCLINIEFSEFCLPLLIYHALNAESKLKQVLTEVFRDWISTFLAYDDATKKLYDVQKKMVQVINIILCLRRAALSAQRNDKVKDYWQYNYLLDVDYSHVSEVAYHCSMHHTAALCLEISTDCLSTSSTFQNVGKSEESTQEFDVASVDSNTITGKQFKRLLYDIYKNVGDVDVIYGVVDCTISDFNARPKIYQMEKNYSKALLASDIQSNKCESHRLILENLLNSGLHQTSLIYLNGLPEENVSKFAEHQFEVAWRNSVWDTSLLRDGHPRTVGFHSNIYYSLQSLKNGSEDLLETYVRNCQLNVISSNELDKKPLTDILAAAYLADHLEKFCQSLLLQTGLNTVYSELPFFDSLQEAKRADSRDNNALQFPIIPHDRFDQYEPAFAVMFEALKIAYSTDVDKGEDIMNAIVELGRNICKTARENKRFEVSEKVLSQLRTINEQTKLSLEWQLEEAELFWAKGETRSAMTLLKHLMKETEMIDSETMTSLHPVALSLYGHWLGESRSQSPVFIMEKYLEPAIEIMESEDYVGKHSPIHAYHTLARYADVQYQDAARYIKSDIFEKKKLVGRKNRDEIDKYSKGRQSSDQNVKRHYKNLEKQCLEDEGECKQAVADQKKFLHKAIYNYCKCLESGDKFDIKIIRLCSLWFDEFSDEEVNNKIKHALDRIESRKLLPIIYQVAARLGTGGTLQCDPFKENVEKIILKCIKDHPHHSVFVLLALCHANMDKKIVAMQKTGKLSQKLLASIDANDKTRIDAACAVLDQLRSEKGKYVQAVEHLANAYIDLAYWDITHLKNESGPFELPNHKQLKKISNLSSVSVPSVDLKVDPSLEYKNIVYISKFEGTFTHCGGVNLPKVVTCICSDGVHRKQLTKGRDDLRQDAVMQQVFGAVNALLQNDANTRRRNLKMRTYKVVPLSKKSGLMEWCEGTMPLGNYLIGGRSNVPGAHQRYHPNDWSVRECRKKLTDATLQDGRNSKQNIFMEIERHFHPVLRHFFLEKFVEPSCWYTKRIAYTKSTAVSSIVGYVVGLGDRHCQNILIDYNSAEVVHIDLGVAFEQGKLLPTPETIPFRLTRDIVDGMGIIGIEGVFRSTCEKTLEVMRKSQEAISTIVEVLLYDPLSQWTITSEKASRLQTKQMNETTTAAAATTTICLDATANTESILDADKNKMAERVLLRLKQKLSGSEGGSFLGVEGQVNYMIREARDNQNLCRLYPGWQPWL